MITNSKKIRGSVGIYVHIPFCVAKCNYCDFYSKPSGKNCVSDYVDALCKQIETESIFYKSRYFDTVFVGGGTPSILPGECAKKLLETIKSSFNLTQGAEFSLESNPETITKEKLTLYKKHGVNRLSMGLQSADDEELKTLGRIHTYEKFEQSFLLARKCGFNNINVDIMYGLPGQTVDKFAKTVDRVCALSPEHISAYCLKIEEKTYFFKVKDTLDIPNDDTEYDMYMSLCKQLKKYGYEQYEISNFSKVGHRCLHNMKYWRDEEYIGFGPSAHSFIDGLRYFYKSDTDEYVSAIKKGNMPQKITENKYAPTKEDNADEYIMLGMRLADGIDAKIFKERFGIDFEEYCVGIERFVKPGFIKKCDGVYAFSEKGFFVSNYILSEMLHFSHK